MNTPNEIETMTCNKCKIDKSSVDFYDSKSWADGKHHWCKECLAERGGKPCPRCSKRRRKTINPDLCDGCTRKILFHQKYGKNDWFTSKVKEEQADV